MNNTALYKSPIVATALALFAMLFGSGNISLPLTLGRNTGTMAAYAMIGFFLSAIIVPIMGIIAMALYDGNYQQFMEKIGKKPAQFVILLCLSLMGPFCVIPRCIALSYSALSWVLPALSLFYFSIGAGVVLFVAAFREKYVVQLMSRFLGPVKLVLLCLIIGKGLVTSPLVISCSLSTLTAFGKGILEGYGTLDLLGVIFFSELLITDLKKRLQGHASQQTVANALIKAGFLGALLLGILYAGFIIAASLQSNNILCVQTSEAQLFSVLAAITLGTGGAILASITIAIACLTTAIALTTVFSHYLHTELPDRMKIPYDLALCITIFISVFFANYGFSGIKSALAPIINVLYPALIMLTLTNALHKTRNIDLGPYPFYLTLVGSFIIHVTF